MVPDCWRRTDVATSTNVVSVAHRDDDLTRTWDIADQAFTAVAAG